MGTAVGNVRYKRYGYILPSFLIVLFYLAVSRGFYLWIYETIGRTPWTGDRPDTRPLPTYRTTQHRETQTHIHAPSRIRTCNLNIRATEDSTCLDRSAIEIGELFLLSSAATPLFDHTPVLNWVPLHEDTDCLIKLHTTKTHWGVEV
jgi:hypothetical protein